MVDFTRPGSSQVHLYYCSANVILLHCFCSLFPYQIWPGISPWFVSVRVHSFWVEFRPGLSSWSKNVHAKILAGHSLGCMNGTRKPQPHSDSHWHFNEARHLCVMGMNYSQRRQWCHWDFVSIIVFFFQRTIISLLSSHKQGDFGGCILEPAVHLKTVYHESLRSFSGMLAGTKAYQRLNFGYLGSHNI